jgi:hypothetical protein
MTTRPLLTTKEVAEYLRVNQYTGYGWLRKIGYPLLRSDHSGLQALRTGSLAHKATECPIRTKTLTI